MVRNGLHPPRWIQLHSWASCALARGWTSIYLRRPSGSTLAALGRLRHTATVILRMGITCGTVVVPVRRMWLVRSRPIHGGSTICMVMCGSGAWTGTQKVCREEPTPKVLPWGRTEWFAAAAIATMRPHAPRPIGTTAQRGAETVPVASALPEPCQTKAVA